MPPGRRATWRSRSARALHHEAITPGGPGDFGMIFMPSRYRRASADTGRIIAALEAILAGYPGGEDLANREACVVGPATAELD